MCSLNCACPDWAYKSVEVILGIEILLKPHLRNSCLKTFLRKVRYLWSSGKTSLNIIPFSSSLISSIYSVSDIMVCGFKNKN